MTFSLLGLNVLIIGRQLRTPSGGRIDLLAIDQLGDIVILELKRDRTPREVVARRSIMHLGSLGFFPRRSSKSPKSTFRSPYLKRTSRDSERPSPKSSTTITES